MNFFFHIFLLFSSLCFSQSATLSGRVVDSQTQEPMVYAEIFVQSTHNKNDFFGVITDEKGFFSLKNIPKGDYLLKISFIGYENFTQPIQVESSKINLGTIALQQTSENLSEVVVEKKRSGFSYAVDRKTINASAFPNATNTIDLLTNVPSLQVSVDGKITYREGGTFSVYINGIAVKDGQERLRTLDASQIEKIDIITNPSARYSASGTAGIIRVTLKKKRLEGYNINSYAQASTLGTHIIGYSIDKKGKRGGWHTSGNYQKSYFENRNSESLNLVKNNSQLFETQEKEKYLANFRIMYLDFGFNYDLTDNDVIDISVGYNPLGARTNRKSEKQITENVFDSNQNLISSQDVGLNDSFIYEYQDIEANLEYSHFFNKDKTHSLKLSSNYTMFLGTDLINKNVLITPSSSQFFGNKSIEKGEIFTSTEINYELPLTEKTSIEAGITIETDNIPEITEQSGYFSGDAIVSAPSHFPKNQFINFTQNIYAGFATFKSSFGSFEYKLGVRAENTFRDILYSYEDVTGRQTDPYKANFTDWFPSVHLLYSFSASSQAVANYSRRINRPNYGYLIPALVWDDKYTLSTGNSRLLPTYTDSYEVGYKKSWGNDFISAEVFARNQHDLHNNYRRPYRDNILLTTPENVGKSWAVGSELMAGVDVLSWWNINTSFTSFYYDENTKIDGVSARFSQWRFSGKLNQTFKLPRNFSARLNTEYQSGQKGLQYDNGGYFLASASLTKSWAENRWQVSISGWNVIDSYRNTSKIIQENFSLRTDNVYHPYFSLGVKYQFNNQK